jgi:acetaldehyde dehydrogenase
MRNTVYVVPEDDEVDEGAIAESVENVVAEVQKSVPGYQLKNGPTFDERETPWGKKPVIMMFLEVEGAGDFLPKYSGNLDIMTASARRVGEAFARHLLGVEEVVA